MAAPILPPPTTMTLVIPLSGSARPGDRRVERAGISGCPLDTPSALPSPTPPAEASQGGGSRSGRPRRGFGEVGASVAEQAAQPFHGIRRLLLVAVARLAAQDAVHQLEIGRAHV